jgi:DMSO/TMAO reductase YedYZ molybdopterin-dependent catalytic subunit
VYCASGYRSQVAASVLAAAGFADVSDLLGGYAAWQAAGLPITARGAAGQAGVTPQAGARAGKALIDAGALLLDVREPGEWQAEHAPDAVLVPMGQLRNRHAELPRDRPIVVICRSGGRSAAVTGALRAAGFDAVNLAGGMCAWAAAGLPVVTARDAGLVVHRTAPLNCETPIPALIGGVVMPNARFYVRNHFGTPALDTATWRLAIAGLVERPLRLSLRDLQNMRSHTLVVTLECAGNGRSMFQPPVEGEPWNLGAVSTAEWTGVPLADVLDRAGPAPGACEVIFRGADAGPPGSPAGSPEPVRFERSLPIGDARGPGALLAYAMNGEPLPIEHGYPLRLIVPGWYAVASVKWLTGIEVTGSPFEGYFQTSRYVYEWDRDGTTVREPVRLQQVRSIITEPAGAAEIAVGELVIRGVAWSGAAPIAGVDIRIGDGPWQPARLVGDRQRHRWQWWELLTHLDEPGPATVRARATDLAGHTQPAQPHWNRLGYGANAIHTVQLQLR